MRQITQWQWYLDEVFVKINGEAHYLWRAVDHEGEVLESYVTKTRDKSEYCTPHEVTGVGRLHGRFLISVAGGRVLAERLVLATGLRDQIPEIRGMADCWGKSAFSSLFCCYDQLETSTVAIVAGPNNPQPLVSALTRLAQHLILLDPHGVCVDHKQLTGPHHRSVLSFVSPVEIIHHEGSVTALKLDDGRSIPANLVIADIPAHATGPLLNDLRCAVGKGARGIFVQTDRSHRTTANRVFAAGDITGGSALIFNAYHDGIACAHDVVRDLLGQLQ